MSMAGADGYMVFIVSKAAAEKEAAEKEAAENAKK